MLETELALGSDLDDSFLESVFFERQLKKSSRMQNAVLSQQQTMLISQKTLSKDGAAPACSFEETKGKIQRLQLLDFRRIVLMFLQP